MSVSTSVLSCLSLMLLFYDGVSSTVSLASPKLQLELCRICKPDFQDASYLMDMVKQVMVMCFLYLHAMHSIILCHTIFLYS